MAKPIKILFFADTHLGFDLPIRPRVLRRRRGYDFFSNYQLILDLALEQQVDLIVHGGDFFFRSKVPQAIVDKALEPLLKIASSGIPVYIVPGNHERSQLPDHLWLTHENIHIFDQPRTYLQKLRECSIALSGFPFTRKVKDQFHTLLRQTNYQEADADLDYLCLHQTFEGAQVGVNDFTFRASPDNIPGAEIPETFTAVLSGHIHRAQQLTHDLDNRPLPAPVIYPGSIERTSFAERLEDKFYVLIEVLPGSGKPTQKIEYHPLPTRPMVRIEIPVWGEGLDDIKNQIRKRLARLNPHSVVQIDLVGPDAEGVQRSLPISHIRALAPYSMNISLRNNGFYRNTTARVQDVQLIIQV